MQRDTLSSNDCLQVEIHGDAEITRIDHISSSYLDITIKTRNADTDESIVAAKLEVATGVFTYSGDGAGLNAADLISKDITQGFAIVYMDESGFKSEMMRPSGYAPIGSPCIGSYSWQAKDRTNIIGALYGKTLFVLDCLKTNNNTEVFYSWCKFTLIPKLKRKCVIVMDNATFHKRVQKLLNRHGHRLLFLPPYSPALNPIEKKWA